MADRRRQGGGFCCAISCTNARNKISCEGKSFFKFPKDEERCKKWVQYARRQDLMNKPPSSLHSRGYLLCSDHFEENQFLRPAERDRLVWNAVPTIFNVPNPPPKATSTRRKLDKPAAPDKATPSRKRKLSTQTEETSGAASADPQPSQLSQAPPCSPSPRKKALLKTLEATRRTLKKTRERLYRARKTVSKNITARRNVKGQTKEKEEVIKDLEHFLPKASCDFISSQLKQIDKKTRGRRWSEKDKATALSLFHASPKAYRILKSVFLLPSVSLLRKTMQKVQVYPGFNEKIFKALQMKVSALPQTSVLCSVVVDEMTIKEYVTYNQEKDQVEGVEDFGDGRTQYVANHATVFILRGLIDNWKQPVGYFLSSGPIDSERLHSLLLECIDRGENVGLSVKLVVADQGSNNRKTFEKFCKVTESKPFFEHNGQKIHLLYDPPHLLKNVRNNLKKTGFLVNGIQVSWNYIAEFYHFDKQNAVRMAPKLTDRHITLPPFAALNVRMAAQVLSHSVAAGISFLAQIGTLPKEAKETAIFVDRFDKLFNAFNSGNLISDKPMGHALTDKSGHKEFLLETLEWLKRVQSCRSLPCLSGWRMAIRTVLALWEDLKANYQIQFLMTDRLNQDCLENLFSQIRGNKGHVENPTAEQFRHFLRQVMVDNFFLHSAGSNCTDDTDKFLLTLTSLISDQQTDNQDDGELTDETMGAHGDPSVSVSDAVSLSSPSEGRPSQSLCLSPQSPTENSVSVSVSGRESETDSEPETETETEPSVLSVGNCGKRHNDSDTECDREIQGQPFNDSETESETETQNEIRTETVRGPSGHDCKIVTSCGSFDSGSGITANLVSSLSQADSELIKLAVSSEPLSKDPQLELAEKNVLVYIAGYIGRKLFSKLCLQCNQLLTGTLTGDKCELLLVNKQYDQLKGPGLFVPSSRLKQALENLEATYIKHIDSILYGESVKARLTEVLMECLNMTSLTCPSGSCDLPGNVVRLFASVRLHATLKDSNSSFAQKGLKKNKKLMKVSYM